jgi:L,D-peptidoglycan transpeptidase YkuD (ErfK/YbiS/YcfS/YnhG family)
MATSSSHLIVTPDPLNPQHGTLRCGERTFSCVLGRSGISASKHEGDGATPTGRFPLRRVLYRADHGPMPQTHLPTAVIARDDGWCDAPTDARYNRPVTLPYPASAESMWRDDNLYDVVVIIGHNDDPVIANAGSAIFMHVAADNGEPTAGCVALARADLLEVLKAVKPDTMIEIKGA